MDAKKRHMIDQSMASLSMQHNTLRNLFITALAETRGKVDEAIALSVKAALEQLGKSDGVGYLSGNLEAEAIRMSNLIGVAVYSISIEVTGAKPK